MLSRDLHAMTSEHPQSPRGLDRQEGDAQYQGKDGCWYTYQDRNIANRLFLEKKFQLEKIQLLYTKEKKKNASTAAAPRTKTHDDTLPVPQERRCSKRERTHPERFRYEVLVRPKSKRTKVKANPRVCGQGKVSKIKAVKSNTCTKTAAESGTCTPAKASQASIRTKKAAAPDTCIKKAARASLCTKQGDAPSPSWKQLTPLILKMRGSVCDSALDNCTNFLKKLIYFEKESLLPPGAKPKTTNSSATEHAKNSRPRKGSDPHSRMICVAHELTCLLDAPSEAKRKRKTLKMCENYFRDLINDA